MWDLPRPGIKLVSPALVSRFFTTEKPGETPVSLTFILGLAYCWTSQVALVVNNLPVNAGDKRDSGSIPGLGRSPGGGHGNPLQYSCLENPMDRGAWWATVHGVAKIQTWLKQLSMHTCKLRAASLSVAIHSDRASSDCALPLCKIEPPLCRTAQTPDEEICLCALMPPQELCLVGPYSCAHTTQLVVLFLPLGFHSNPKGSFL